MKTATVADLRNNFRKISSWIEHGEKVQITKRGRAFAELSGISDSVKSQKPLPVKDIFMAQLKTIWGDKVFSMEEVEEMRAAELEGEEG